MGSIWLCPVPGAPLGVQEARRLAAAGTLLMASRYLLDRAELVVRLSTATRRDVGESTPSRP